MTGLKNLDTKSERVLRKEAGEGSVENNLRQLITEEAYSQISSKFPKLISMIVGIEIVDVIDDETALGAAALAVPDKKIIIPIVYSNGVVTADSFLYSEDDDIMLALTKKTTNLLLKSNPLLSGVAISEKDAKNIDRGGIQKVFVPPKTFNPKIASSSGGLLFAVLEQSDLLKTAMLKKLEDEDYKKSFENAYGHGAVNRIRSMPLEKTAGTIDETRPKVLYSLSEVTKSGWLYKKAAAREFAENGFVISHGKDTQKKHLRKIASVETRLKETTGDNSFQTIDFNSPGIYAAYRMKDLTPVDLLISRDITRKDTVSPHTVNAITKDGASNIIGKKISYSDSNIFENFSMDVLEVNRNNIFVLFKDGEVFGDINIYISPESISDGLGTVTLETNFSILSALVIEKGSDSQPVRVGGRVYVGDRNVKLLTGKNIQEPLVRLSDLTADNITTNIVKIAYDGTEFIYNGKAYSRQDIVNHFLDNGYEKKGIYDIVKTAASDGSAEFAAINAKIDMLSTMIMNLAGKVESCTSQDADLGVQDVSQVSPQEVVQDPSQLTQDPTQGAQDSSQGAQSQAQAAQGLSQVAQPASSQAQAQQGPQTALSDPNSGIQTPDQQAASQQQQQDQVAQDQSMLGQTPPPQEQDISGMNTSIDPAVLDALSKLKNSNIMDVGVISMLANSSDMSQIIAQYKGEFLNGTSAIGRILLNAMVKQNDVSESIGANKMKQLLSVMKSVFFKMSDLYVDIARLEVESDRQMAD